MEPQVVCKQCQQQSRLIDCVREQSTQVADLTESLLVCPVCGLRSHICFLSERSRALRRTLEVALIEWRLLDTALTRRQLAAARRAYEQSYDADQRTYRHLVTEASHVANT